MHRTITAEHQVRKPRISLRINDEKQWKMNRRKISPSERGDALSSSYAASVKPARHLLQIF